MGVYSVNPADYLNRKNNYSFNAQAVADYQYKFIDVSINFPGAVHDARIFANSSIHLMLRNGVIPPCKKVIVEGKINGPCLFIG